MSFVPRQRPVVLCVLDGLGHRRERADDNAIMHAHTPNLDRLSRESPIAYLQASELHVGLPVGQMGNSEVGHMNLGAGRVVMQDLPRIDQAVADGSLAKDPALANFIAAIKRSRGAVHLMGLMSPGGVHSHQDHIAALARTLGAAGLTVWVHAFLDGRDTPPKSADGYLRKFLADIAGLEGVRVGTVAGRYYAMDRDKRWERCEKAYRVLVDAEAEHAADPVAAIERSHAANVTDEFVLPVAIGDPRMGGYRGMTDGDGLMMANFRSDRAREILTALLDPAFDGFKRPRVVAFAATLGMVEYSSALNRFMPALFPPKPLTHMLGEVVAEAGLKQLRIAETEKYAHVTFFFNGGEEREFPGEKRILVPSPKVATYDMKPEMSANELTDRLVAAIDGGEFDLIVCNYANTDMVGHTGDYQAAVRAVEAVDACLGRVAAAITRAGGALILTADHGNAEVMVDPATGQPHTAHTTNPVPVMVVNAQGEGRNAPIALRDGKLADVAPTVLELLGLAAPKEMTGHSLIQAPPPPEAPASEAHRAGGARFAD